MKKFSSLFIILIMVTTFFPTVVFAHSGGDKTGMVVDLIAGKSIDVGDVKVWNDGDFLYVKYRTDDPFCLTETHLQVASSLDEIPQANGNPIPGQFEYQESHGCVSKYTYTTQIDKNSCDLYIAAHAVVKKNEYDNRFNTISKSDYGHHKSSTETAWGSGIDFPGENWATYFIYSVEGCNVHPNPKLSLTKEADPLIYDSVGQLITYNYVIKNTGNVNLTGPFSVTDDKILVS